MNSSVYSADRATYLRIVTVALLASMAIVGFAISVRTSAPAMTMGSSWKARGAEPGRRRRAAIASAQPTRSDQAGRIDELAVPAALTLINMLAAVTV